MFGPLPAAQIPPGQCVYAIGDIHGRADLLTALLGQIQADASDQLHNILIFLGDYVDRGPQSQAVLELVTTLDWPGWTIVKLRGNHEQAVLDFLSNSETYASWRNFGGGDTLWSYGVKPPSFSNPAEVAAAQDAFRAALPRSHYAFLVDLPCAHSIGDYYFVHAGVHPGLRFEDQIPADQLWIRDDFLLSDARLEKVVVHGHTPSQEPVVRRNRIGIDTGAYATNRLTAVRLCGSEVRFLAASL